MDKIYLDTSFLQPVPFQTKVEGIAELLRKVARYPPGTIFHLQAWTFGYEHVWIALAKFLNSKIHVDDYKFRMYRSLIGRKGIRRFDGMYSLCPEASALAGHMCGNTQLDGCLTQDISARIHSCEKGVYCETILKNPVVWIQPIVSHIPGQDDIVELGVGGGAYDLQKDVELEVPSEADVKPIIEL